MRARPISRMIGENLRGEKRLTPTPMRAKNASHTTPAKRRILIAARAFQAGASGYVTKQEMSGTLLIAIRRLLDGEKHVRPRTEDTLDRK